MCEWRTRQTIFGFNWEHCVDLFSIFVSIFHNLKPNELKCWKIVQGKICCVLWGVLSSNHISLSNSKFHITPWRWSYSSRQIFIHFMQFRPSISKSEIHLQVPDCRRTHIMRESKREIEDWDRAAAKKTQCVFLRFLEKQPKNEHRAEYLRKEEKKKYFRQTRRCSRIAASSSSIYTHCEAKKKFIN